MLHTLVLFSQNPDVKQTLETTADATLNVAVPSSARELPPWTVAVVADESRLDDSVKAAELVAKSQEETLNLLGRALDCREGLLSGSSWRVMEHTERFGRALGMSRAELAAVTRAALLRDIGKVLIPNSVLLKEGVLNYEEWTLIQRHPHLGAELIGAGTAFRETAEIIKYHHECFDGDGYPEGLEGDAIPLPARVLRIVDVYCAMTSPRLYRKHHSSHDEAVAYLQSEQGKHFDPQLVEVFLEQNIGKPWPEKTVEPHS